MPRTRNEPLLLLRATRAVRGESRVHAITLDVLLRLLETQGYACAICERVMVDGNFKSTSDEIDWKASRKCLATPHVDYCPITGVVRGLLCAACRKLLTDQGDLYGGLLERRGRIIPQPKWVNPKPNRRHRKRKRKSHFIRREYAHARFGPLKCRRNLYAYFTRELDESLISARWRADHQP